MRAALFGLALIVAPATLLGQSTSVADRPAVLVADRVFITRDRVLVADGNVEAFQGETRLRASAIRYDQDRGALSIEGPIVLSEGDSTTILADAAELDGELQSGLLRGARMILEQQLQLAAVQINRVEGRYSQLYKAAVTSCKLCEDGEAPLWQIRAKRVVHDEVAQQLYFDEAQFLIKTVPIFYLPRLRLPDPTLDRASGFLAPTVRSTSQLSVGLKLPYFIKIGDHRDLTLTPYLSSKTRTMEFRYRQAFVAGRIEFNGGITRDDLQPDDTRGYLFGSGTFDLRRDYKLDFGIETTSDRSYLNDYGYSVADRLTSELTVSRTRRDEYTRASLLNYQSLRDGDVNDYLPTLVLDGEYQKRYFPARIGGEVRLSLEAHSHRRASDVSANGLGRDVSRLNGDLDWMRRLTFGNGLVSDLQLGTSFGLFNIAQDADYTPRHSDMVPKAAVALRYPMQRREAGGAVQQIEPLVQLAWTGGDRLDIPNEESTLVEYDEGNLLALSRFPRPDRRERGAVMAFGVNWARIDPNGWDANLSVGQVIRDKTDADFSFSSGLEGTQSDFLIAGQLRNDNGFAVIGRGLVDDDFQVAKAELRGVWNYQRGQIAGSYVWLSADDDEERDDNVSEITFDGSYAINNQWQATADWRFDVEDERAARAGLGLSYNNECVQVDVSVNRRYSSSTSVEPSTDFGFNIGLRGFAANTGTERYVRSCGK
ncbi:LPS-assembly protein LptD [Sulfitobacter sp. S0837]|uniref:LPS-assembly protein LptD n=1 Tax=Sulfitobacter maritimus TaxID=2741719 RepID=UPI0015830CFD|nr:LPS assembly protein LptD [Sulfitobacter maritimus]NUH64389.1 LPS-assembly protein LptD [Sulfitobacter maritimus]